MPNYEKNINFYESTWAYLKELQNDNPTYSISEIVNQIIYKYRKILNEEKKDY